MITFLPETQGDTLAVRLSGRVTRDDYRQFRERAEALLRDHGHMRVLMDLEGLSRMEPGVAWDDMKFGLAHLGQFDSCAVVGDRAWERWVAYLGKPFMRVAYFDRSERDRAQDWLRQPAPAHAGHGFLGDVAYFARRHPLTAAAVGVGVGALMFWTMRPHGPARSSPAGMLSA
jgi:hypothetical protein